jgi:cell division septum initiation protein DivIVA
LSLVQDVHQYTKSAAGDVNKLEKKIEELEKKVNELQRRQEGIVQPLAKPNQAGQEFNTPTPPAK